MAILKTENKTLGARLAASEKGVAAYKHLVKVQDKTLEKHKAILTRAKHLEAHVEHRSLGRHALRGARLPGLSNPALSYWRMMDWNPTSAECKEIYDLEQYFESDERFQFDHMWPFIDSFLDGEEIPPIPCNFQYPLPRDRIMSPCRGRSPSIPSFLRESISDSGSQGFEIVSMKSRNVATCVKLEDVGYPTPASTA
jgi:hypothetical protein